LEQNKSGGFVNFDETSALVLPSGEMSNFLIEDYEAVMKFMNAEKQTKDLNCKQIKRVNRVC